MGVQLDVQYGMRASYIPSKQTFQKWAALIPVRAPKNLVLVRIVNKVESKKLNTKYRGKRKATNVLAFPFDAPKEIELKLLGDVVICAPVVRKEAMEQDKSLMMYWAHVLIHGILHLQGFTHYFKKDAKIMERKEVQILSKLGFPNPYK